LLMTTPFSQQLAGLRVIILSLSRMFIWIIWELWQFAKRKRNNCWVVTYSRLIMFSTTDLWPSVCVCVWNE
jgi:hypothetical protein